MLNLKALKLRLLSLVFTLFLILAGWAGPEISMAQEKDSIAESQPLKIEGKKDTASEVTKSPGRAAWMSAALPGLGQIYNDKYWKVPIIYAGLATSIYFIVDNRREYLFYRQAYINEIDGDSTTVNTGLSPGFTAAVLRDRSDQFRGQMELSYIITAAIYVLQIVDASVDAHLYSFDVSDDLSLEMQPQVFRGFHPTQGQTMYTGLNMKLSIGNNNKRSRKSRKKYFLR